MMKKINLTEAVTMRLAGVPTDGYEVEGDVPIEDKIVKAALKHSVFAARTEYQLAVIGVFPGYAVIHSVKDNTRYRIDFGHDANNDVRITRIVPIEPPRVPMPEQLENFKQQKLAGIELTERQVSEGNLLAEQWQEKQEQIAIASPAQRYLAGVTSGAEFASESEALLEKKSALLANGGKEPLFEDGEDGAAKRKKLWAAQRSGEISLDECLDQCAKIRLSEEKRPAAQLLMERKYRHNEDCNCGPCEIANKQVQLEDTFAAGKTSKRCHELSLELLSCTDPTRRKQIESDLSCYCG